MKSKPDITEKLVSLASLPVIGMPFVWKSYGYDSRPTHGTLIKKLFPMKFELSDFITKELFILGTVDVLVGIQDSNIHDEDKIFLAGILIDRYIYFTKPFFKKGEFIHDVVLTYIGFKDMNDAKFNSAMIKRTSKLSEENRAKFIYGTISLLSPDRSDPFFIDKQKIIDLITSGLVNREIGFYDVEIGNNTDFNKLLDAMSL